MLHNVRKNIRTSFPFQRSVTEFGHAQELYDTIQTMNISQTLNFSILLIFMDLVNLGGYLAVNGMGRLFSPVSFNMMVFLLFLTGNLFCTERLLQLERNAGTRRLFKFHSYVFTAVFGCFCLSVNFLCLKNRMSAESILMFYIYIAAGPIYTCGETLAAILATAILSLAALVHQQAPAAMYCNLLLYSFISLFLSQVRGRLIGTNLRLLREARDEQLYLQSMAENDPLTHILNRNGFSQRLDTLLTNAIQLQMPVAVIMADIDYFKQYNDTYGHMAGDECLQKVACALASHVHQGRDLICRFGGEEFQIFLYGIKPGDALQVADRLRRSIADLKLPSADGRIASCVTISVGVSGGVPASMDSYADMVQAADNALYHAKSHGKNRICFRDPKPSKASGEMAGSPVQGSPARHTETAPVARCVSVSWELNRF